MHKIGKIGSSTRRRKRFYSQGALCLQFSLVRGDPKPSQLDCAKTNSRERKAKKETLETRKERIHPLNHPPFWHPEGFSAWNIEEKRSTATLNRKRQVFSFAFLVFRWAFRFSLCWGRELSFTIHPERPERQQHSAWCPRLFMLPLLLPPPGA